ncbi:MAG TPA: tubulin-like doman-containing protein [Gemmataceae bacterium]|nr:tubulin-like doman-containing protein [Gemmataceae bacterium]
MALRIESQAEPIPGYKLLERLGGGGFGEVWKAEAPGGLFKAIKFVYGDLQAPEDEDGSRAIQELKGLNRVKSVHHPFILSIERYDIIDGQLIIIMELADRTLWDRFRECRAQGLPGIPRDELLGYMEETAEALDLMYHHYNLQHLDIKPQNLFLVFNHVKVADFGLAKDLEGKAVITVTGGLTPVYAAPETFDGWLSPSSDQYSLAIVYQELLTGQRPFAGTTIRQLVLQHVQGAPDLTSLLVAERPSISKALSKNPDDRYPTCLDFINALRASTANPVVKPVAEADKNNQAVPLPVDSRKVASTPRDKDPTSETTQNALGRLPKPKREGIGEAVPSGSRLPRSKPVIKAEPAVVPSGFSSGPELINTSLKINPTRALYGAGVLRPAMVIGLGRTGLAILKHLRAELNDQFGHPDNLPNIRLLYLDTDPEAAQAATKGTADALLPREVLLAQLGRASQYLRPREGKVPFENWLDSKVLYRIPRQRNHAGLRALGRLAFVDNQATIQQRLETALAVCTAPETLEDASKKTGLEKLTSVPRVYIAGSLAGGTGSGMFIDLAYVIRQHLRSEGHANAELVGVFLVPEAGRDGHASGLANAVAALTELNHFAGADAVFAARYDSREMRGATRTFQEKGPPFQHCYLLPFTPTKNNQASPDTAQAGHFLFYSLATPLGHIADHCRRQAGRALNNGELSYHTFGSHRIAWPRRYLLEQGAGRLCTRLVQHWMSKDSRHVHEEIKHWAQEQWEAQEFRPEKLIARHQELCAKNLQQSPEKMFNDIMAPLVEMLTPKNGMKPADITIKIAPVVQAVDRLEALLGLPDECRPQGMEPSILESALTGAAETIADECDQKLAELVVRLFEEPLYRLAGAEEAVRQLTNCVELALESQESLVRELQDRTISVHQRLHALLESPRPQSPTASTPRWRSPFTRRVSPAVKTITPTGADFVDLLSSYAKCRYQSLILMTINSLYVRLRGYLSDQMREVGFCRHRLTELADLVKDRNVPAQATRSDDHVLVPEGCANVRDFLQRLENDLNQDIIVDFDEQVQKLVRRQFRALVQVCMASSHVIRTLAPALLQEAESFLEPRLQGANVAELLLARYPDDDEGHSQLAHELLQAYDEAAPELASPAPDQEVCLITVPPGPAGDRFRTLAQSLFPKAMLVSTDCSDEILFYRGCLHMNLSDLEQLGPAGQAAYRSATAQDPSLLHSRADIAEWRSAVAVHS